MKKYDIKEMMIDNLAMSIALSVVWTIILGVFTLLGAKDYTLPALLLGCAVIVVALWLVLTATFLLLMLYEKAKMKMRKRKTEKFLIKKAKAFGIYDDLNSRNGEELETFIKEKFYIKREAGESDEELRYRCIKTIVIHNEILREIIKS